jgi:uncharacterized protein (DUF58 family)
MFPISLLPKRRGPGGEPGSTRSLFFNRAWIGGAAIVLVVGVATGATALSLLALLVLVTAGLGAGWNRWALVGVEYRRELSADRAFPGDEVTLTITVVNRKPLPLPWLAIEDELAEALQPLDRETTMSGTTGRRVLRIVTNVRPFERVTWRVPVRCPARGLQTLGPATLRAADPFGFFASRLTFEVWGAVLVYPRLIPLPELGFPPRLALGETRVVRHLLSDPSRVVGVRDYRPDDPFRAIHWKATARQGTLQVRIAEPTTTLQLAIFVNLDTFEHYWEGLDVATAERTIEVAASVAAWASGQRYAVGVYANGVVAGSDQALRVPPGRGPAQLPRVLEGLAKISPYSTVAFGRTLRAGSTRLPWGSTVVVVTSLLPEGLLAQMAALLAGGYRVVLVTVGEVDVPMVRGLVVRRVEGVAKVGADAGGGATGDRAAVASPEVETPVSPGRISLLKQAR